MKKCPYCTAENRDEAVSCFYCGHDLSALSTPPEQPSKTEPTQPVHARPTSSQPYTSPAHTTQPLPKYSPQPADYPPPYQQGYPSSAYQQPTNPQAVNPPPDLVRASDSNRKWLILAGILGFLLLCVGGLALWTITSSAKNRSNQIDSQRATEAANGIPGIAVGPTDLPGQVQPSPWPTFTALPAKVPPATAVPPEPTSAGPVEPVQPTAVVVVPTETQVPVLAPPTQENQSSEVPAPSQTAEPAAGVDVEKYLSPECAGALEALSQLQKDFSSQPTAPLDSDWRKNFSQATSELTTACGSLDSASPVPHLVATANQELSLASAEFDQAGNTFNEGLREWNPGKMWGAVQHIQQATSHLNQAMAELKKIGQ